MHRVKDLYDAIVKPDKNEDKCTNLLIWLLSKVPESVLQEICRTAGLSFCPSSAADYRIQVPLEDSRPDAMIESDGQYLVIETKLFPGSFKQSQFLNHLKGATRAYGSDNVWLLFLSGDASAPESLRHLCRRHPDHIGFVSWRSLLSTLRDPGGGVSEKHQALINEFILFASRLRLGRILAMTNEDLARFVELNAFVLTRWDPPVSEFMAQKWV